MPKNEAAAMRSMEGRAPKPERAPKKKPQSVETSHDANAAEHFQSDAKKYVDLRRKEAKLSKELKKLTALRVQGLGSDATEKMLFDELADVQMQESMLTGQYGALDEKFVETVTALEGLKKKDALAAHKLGEELIMDFVLEAEEMKKEAARVKRMKKPAVPPPLPPDVAANGFTPLETSSFAADADLDTSATLLADIRAEIAEASEPELEPEPDHFMPPPPNPKLPGDRYIHAVTERAATESRSVRFTAAAKELNAVEKRIKGKFGIDPETFAEEKKGFWERTGQKMKLFINPELRDAVEEYREARARLEEAS